MKKILLLLLLIMMSTTACGEQELAHGETYADSPLAANRKAAEAIAKEENIKETKAEHQYDTSKVNSDKDTIVIGEKLFLTQINDIYNNFQRYDGKTVVVEGMLGNYTEWDKSLQNAVVFRNGPGCCGNDGWGGFFLTDVELIERKTAGDGQDVESAGAGENAGGQSTGGVGEGKTKYVYAYKGTDEIELDDWIKVTGKPQLYEATDTEGRKKTYLFLEVENLENHKNKDRGAEYVSN